MTSKILINSETIKIEYFFNDDSQNTNLAFVFTPSYNRNLDGNNYGGEVFFRGGFDVVAFKISNDDWFQSIPENVFKDIKDIDTLKNYKKKIAYGSSMGGFASIAFSKILNANAVVAYSPQYKINEEFDKRWKNYAQKIDFKYPISKETINVNCKFFIFYDNKNPDNIHVNKIAELIPNHNITLLPIPFSGHPTAHYLSEVGLIKDILICIANDGSLAGIDFFKNKKLSKSYFHNLSINLLNRKHFKWALDTIDSAIKIDNRIAEYYAHKSIILEKIGNIKEAVASINQAIILNPIHAYYQNNLSRFTSKMGLNKEAIEISKKAFQLSPNDPFLLHHLSCLLMQELIFEEALFAIDSAIKIDQNVALFHEHKSELLDKMGKLDNKCAS